MNFKIIFLIGILILFYLYLFIKKNQYKDIIIYKRNNNIKNIEKFENLIMLNDDQYRRFYDKNKIIFTSQIKGFVNIFNYEDKKNILKYTYDKTNINIDTPSGIVFDKNNDDIIYFDTAYVKRLQLRPNRDIFDTNLPSGVALNLSISKCKNLLEEKYILFVIYINKLCNQIDVINKTQRVQINKNEKSVIYIEPFNNRTYENIQIIKENILGVDELYNKFLD